MTMPWTRLEGTPIWRQAVAHYAEPWRDYHGLWHLERIYHHAQATFGFAYDHDLDLAILTHDVVMHFEGRDELLSARWLNARTQGLYPRSEAFILTTKDHRPGPGDSRMARLDLANFMFDDERREGTSRLRNEARNRGIPHEQWRKGSHTYLMGLYDRVSSGIPRELDLEVREQWHLILTGIGAALADIEASWCGFGAEASAK